VDNLTIVLLSIGAVFVLYFLMKWSSKCPSCGEEWGLKTTNSYKEPRSTSVQRRVGATITVGGNAGGQRRRQVTEETIEVGNRVVEKMCKSCSHQITNRSSYRQVIHSNTYEEDV
jgi:predicted RNA-binding Zn-ribbon protein involved in translation (DUF1610 family)